ncbi:hypothetical protein PHLGIDRAFT_127366 [Phlebiopsis gigantea 11061_1 CR5-6]|uniref:Uncharacterized protein n=1 Tax=Phlebiopsis gigantea (strain 11061_1 CR5-6) TaxID=745531 RepID=A0A0C3SBG5_PHLG1|nr:hypothetical protein PHLGIDRAFT_127366 [Phlebiopsis gigantea 11061_1 CR5-6]
MDMSRGPVTGLAGILAHPLVCGPLCGALALLFKSLYDNGLCNPQAVAKKIMDWATTLKGMLNTVLAEIDKRYPKRSKEKVAFMKKLKDVDSPESLQKMDNGVYGMALKLVQRARHVMEISVYSLSRYKASWEIQDALSDAALVCKQYESRLMAFSERAIEQLNGKNVTKQICDDLINSAKSSSFTTLSLAP